MGNPTTVNSQVTDAVTQSNISVVGGVPAFAMGSMYQALGHSVSLLFESMASAQRQQNTLSQAAANQGVMQSDAVDTMADAAATEKMEQGGEADHLSSLETVQGAFAS